MVRSAVNTPLCGTRGLQGCDAAKEAVVAAVLAVYAGELPKLLPSATDPMAPPDPWGHGPDELREDSEFAVSGQ